MESMRAEGLGLTWAIPPPLSSQSPLPTGLTFIPAALAAATTTGFQHMGEEGGEMGKQDKEPLYRGQRPGAPWGRRLSGILLPDPHPVS